MSSLKQEELIKRSPRGQRVTVLFEAIEKMKHEKITSIAVPLVTKVSACFDAGNKHKLPSAAQACVLSTFHQLRVSTVSSMIEQVTWFARSELIAWTTFSCSLTEHSHFQL